jgi:hypothetical protein
MNTTEPDYSNFGINYQRIVEDTDMLAVTRLLASTLMSNPYYTIGNFLTNLSDSDVDMLISVDTESMDVDPLVGDIILIAEMLADAEGSSTDRSMDSVQARASQLIAFIVLESLARKGLVKLYRENMSFGDDMGDKIVVEKLFDV